MHKSALSLLFITLLLTACTFKITTFESNPATPTTLPIDRLATQVSAPLTQTPVGVSQPVATTPLSVETGELIYFWPTSLSPEIRFDGVASLYTADGYVIEFDHLQTGASTVLRAGTEADRFPYCAGQAKPDHIRGLEGCSSLGTGAGAGVEWRENGVHYSVGGIGNSMEAVLRFAESLEALADRNWQQKFAESSNTSHSSSERARIEFVTGTTSHKSALQELASSSTDEYIVGALAGQELTVNIAPYDIANIENFVLNISGADGSVLLSEAVGTHTWTGALPATQDYVIRVTNKGNAALYQLNVSIPWRFRLSAGETSTFQGRHILGMDGNIYLLEAQAGQTVTVTVTSENNNICLTIAARMTDGSYIPLINAASRPAITWSDILPTGAEYSQVYSISPSQCPNAPAMNTAYTLFVSVTE